MLSLNMVSCDTREHVITRLDVCVLRLIWNMLEGSSSSRLRPLLDQPTVITGSREEEAGTPSQPAEPRGPFSGGGYGFTLALICM